MRNDPELAEKVIVRQSLTLPPSPDTIELDSGEEGDDEEEEGMGASDWNNPDPEDDEDENGDAGTGSDTDSASEWENPITPPTSPDGDGHECCNGPDECQEGRFCHFPGPGTNFIPCICISDESSNDSSVLFLGETGIQEVVSVQSSSAHTTSNGSGRPMIATPRPGAEANQASTAQMLQPQPLQLSDPPRLRREFLLGDETDVPYESDARDYIDRDSFYYVKDHPKRYR